MKKYRTMLVLRCKILHFHNPVFYTELLIRNYRAYWLVDIDTSRRLDIVHSLYKFVQVFV